MAKYKRVSDVLEAFKYDGDLKNSLGEYYVPEWAVKAFEEGILFYEGEGDLFVLTLKGGKIARVGDFIIQGIKGEIYPCNADIFNSLYEKCE